ncbi:hypothetical protein [Cupriavidus necator]|nr:hypothetical protein [Cupriavidus necator]
MRQLSQRRHVAAESIIDFSAAKWSPVNKPGRSDKTLARVEAGRARYG